MPLTIDSDTGLDAVTQSAIKCGTGTGGTMQCNIYYPPETKYQKYREAKTNISVTIKDILASPSSPPTFTDSLIQQIQSDSSSAFQFVWGAGESIPGNYTVTLTSHVTDTKCSSIVDDVKTQNIQVFPELPDKACVIVADPMTTSPSSLTKAVSGMINIPAYSYYLNKTYKGIYENLPLSDPTYYEEYLLYRGITSTYTLILTNSSNRQTTLSGSFPRSFDGVIVNSQPEKPINTAAWTPGSYGAYSASLVMSSNDNLCPATGNDFARGTRTDTFNILPRDFDNDGFKEDIDCNDADSSVYPNAPELCDGKDNQCQGNTGYGQADENCAASPYYCDTDNDNYYSIPASGTCISGAGNCPPARCVFAPGNDCNENIAGINPGKTEICTDADFIDENCNGYANCYDSACTNIFKDIFNPCTGTCPAGYVDLDENPNNGCEYQCTKTNAGIETCDGLDNDCDNIIDMPTCCAQGDSKSCNDDSSCPGVSGTRTCSNYQWGECNAPCPQSEVGIKVDIPEEGRTYYTCSDSVTKIIKFSSSEKCTYKMQYTSAFKDIKPGDRVTFRVGTTIFTLMCGGVAKEVRFNVEKVDTCTPLNTETDTASLIDFLDKESPLTENEISDAKNTGEVIDQGITYSYENGETIIKHTLDPKNELKDVEVRLYLPKECFEELKKIDFDLSDYKVIKEDPLIAWHFADVKDRLDLTYKVKGTLSPECMEKIRLLPMAKSIGARISDERAIDRFIIPALIASGIIALGIYAQRFHPGAIKQSEEEYEKKAVLQGRMHLLNEVKSMNFKTKLQMENYMRGRGYSEEEIEWLLKKI